MKVIAISGKAGSGKDTIAGIIYRRLRESWVTCRAIHYADLLKYICTSLFDWDGKKNEPGRELLQYVGTDVIRKENPDYWVNFVIDMLHFFGDRWEYVLIPDARFPNEIDRLRDAGFDVHHLRVVRPRFDNGLTAEQKKHPSETAMNEYTPDSVIFNDCTQLELEKKVKIWMEDNVWGR